MRLLSVTYITVIILFIGTGLRHVVSAPSSEDGLVKGRTPEEIEEMCKSILADIKQWPAKHRTPQAVSDFFLKIELALPRGVDLRDTKMDPVYAKVRITNISDSGVGLLCDPSPRATTYLRVEAKSGLGSRAQRDVTVRDLIYDLGDQLANDGGQEMLHILAPKESVESRIDIMPILRHCGGPRNVDYFAVQVELWSLPWWTSARTDSSIYRWEDRGIVSDDVFVQVVYPGEL